MDAAREDDPRRQRGNDDGRAPAVSDDGSRHAALPRDQRQRLGDQEQVRQHLRLPAFAARRPGARDRRHAGRQGRRRVRLRRGRQGLRAGAAWPGLPCDRLAIDINLIDTRIYTKLIREVSNTSNENINWEEVPLFVDLNAEFKGSLEDFVSHLDLQTGKGSVKANVAMNANEKYKGDVIITNFEAGSLAGIPDLGKVSLGLKFNGQYFDMKKAFVDLNLQIDSIDYNSYTYKSITANITLKNENADINIVSDDPTIDFTLDGKATINENITGNVELDLRYVDLKKLNFVEENYLIIGNINTSFELQDSSEMSVDLALNQFQFFVDSEKYLLENSKFSYTQTSNTVNLTGTPVSWI